MRPDSVSAARRRWSGDRVVLLASRGYLLAVCVVAGVLTFTGDAWWPATVGLYAPRWPWLLPLVVLLPAALWLRRAEVVPLVAAGAIGAVGILHANLPMAAWTSPAAGRPRLRIASYNIGGINTTTPALLDVLSQIQPDAIALQECGGTVRRARTTLEALGWVVHEQTGSCLLSRLPVSQVVEHDPTELRAIGGNGVGVRYDLQVDGFSFSVVNLHPGTVRAGVEAVIQHGLNGAGTLDRVTAVRDLEASRLAAFVGGAPGPVLVTGDFNMPEQSAIYRRHWAGFVNAFSRAGWGTGGTKATSWHQLRIDHVLAGPGWTVHAARVGPHLGGDHRPMVAEVSWTGGPAARD